MGQPWLWGLVNPETYFWEVQKLYLGKENYLYFKRLIGQNVVKFMLNFELYGLKIGPISSLLIGRIWFLFSNENKQNHIKVDLFTSGSIFPRFLLNKR